MTTYTTSIERKVQLTAEREKHILERHPDISPHFSKIKTVLLKPDQIRVSRHDPKALLFYKYFSRIKKYLAVVIKIDTRNFLLTFYSTRRIKTGERYGQSQN